jgi:AcrR family transcriptional regulator
MLDSGKKRARSDDDKLDRRQTILGVARQAIGESGFDGVTMADLARRAGLAKGTLYLYFRTKEEVFLALFVDALDRFVARMEKATDAKNLIAAMTDAALEVPLFLPLYARLTAVIEANVADEPLFAAKRAIMARGGDLVPVLARVLELTPERAWEVGEALMLLLQGAAQFDLSSQRDPQTLPEDLRPVFARHAFRERFPVAAAVILSGLGGSAE